MPSIMQDIEVRFHVAPGQPNPGYAVQISTDEDGTTWLAEHPELPGCVADGMSPETALAALNICRGLWIESRRAAELSVPAPIRRVR